MNLLVRRVIMVRYGAIWRFAMELGLHPSVISGVLAGRRRLSLEQRARWSELLGIDDRLFEPEWNPLRPLEKLLGGPMAQEDVESDKCKISE